MWKTDSRNTVGRMIDIRVRCDGEMYLKANTLLLNLKHSLQCIVCCVCVFHSSPHWFISCPSMCGSAIYNLLPLYLCV